MNRKVGRAVPSPPSRGAVRTPRPTSWRGSWSQCTTARPRRLSMNRRVLPASCRHLAGKENKQKLCRRDVGSKLVAALPDTVRSRTTHTKQVPLLGGVKGGFMSKSEIVPGRGLLAVKRRAELVVQDKPRV